MTTLERATDQARALPRAAVGTALAAARLPLTAAERLAGQADNAEWPPTMAFEAVEASVETTVGTWLRDAELQRRGRLRAAKLAKLREAGALSTVAEGQRTEAEQRFTEREAMAEQRREQAQEQAAQRERAAEQRTAARKSAASTTAAARKRNARKQAAAKADQLDRQERTAKLAALTAEEKALQAEREAVATTDAAAAVDDALTATKETRTSA